MSNFYQVHQSPKTYAKSASLDVSGALVIDNTPPLVGFRDQYSPTGVTGCAIGYPELRSLCQYPGGISFQFPGYWTGSNEIRVYIPKGTTFFSVTANFPQNTKFVSVARILVPPTKTSADDVYAQYETYRSAQSNEDTLAKLAAGQDAIRVHNFGGNLSLTGDIYIDSGLTEGGWIYIRMFPQETQPYLLSGICEVNREMYREAFSQITFGADGDPIEIDSVAQVVSTNTTTQTPVVTTPTEIFEPLNPAPVINPLELSGNLAQVAIDAETTGYLIYTVPTGKTATINIDACIRNSNNTDLTFYVGSGTSPTVTDMVKQTNTLPYITTDERKRDLIKNQMNVSQLMLSGGDKIWVTVKKK